MDPATNLETALSHCKLGYSPVWPWSCHQHHLPRDLPGIIPPMPQVTGSLTSTLTVDPELVHDQAPATPKQESYLFRDQTGDTSKAGPQTYVWLQILNSLCNSVPVPCSFRLGTPCLPRDPPRDTPVWVSGGRPANFSLTIDHVAAPVTGSSISEPQTESSPPHQGTYQETHVSMSLKVGTWPQSDCRSWKGTLNQLQLLTP